jgi:alginate O-acetyltransferase complex protein AlgJ
MHKNFRVFDFLLILTFILSLYLPLLMTNNRDISIIEKRKLTKFPQVKWNHKIAIPITFPSQFEAFFNDHFGFRDHLAQLYYLYSFMLKSTSNPNVLIGQEGWLFYVKTADGNSLEDFRGNDSLLPEELWQWRAVLEAKYAWLKQSGVEYFFVIAPDKHSIYAEYFPARIRKVGKYSRLDQLLEYMKDSKVPIIDLRPPLLQAKNKELVYYKTDTHWNDFGVAVAQYTILQYFTKFNFAFHPIKFDVADFGLVQYSGDLAQMLNLSSALTSACDHLCRKGLQIDVSWK